MLCVRKIPSSESLISNLVVSGEKSGSKFVKVVSTIRQLQNPSAYFRNLLSIVKLVWHAHRLSWSAYQKRKKQPVYYKIFTMWKPQSVFRNLFAIV